ncbi:MAG TPA: HTH domain-containing protein [Candidatus Moranbacteria bacterium]|jgi:DNA-directed RNA polymerase delta subunit|nr:HTH domain-containing protein [Candidatus Moranbacteria bacterium]HQB59248.1 HTH domain-containing protein [Candidatus Moranbacteria bacterium]
MESSSNQPQKNISENFFFSDALKEIISGLSKRSQEIIFIRYGVHGGNALTLEEIGNKYNITRERVRQIVHEVVRKICEKKDNPYLVQAKTKITLAIQSNSGIIEKKKLASELGKSDKSEEAAISFFLECVDGINYQEIPGVLKASYSTAEFNVKKWKSIKDAAVEMLEKKKSTLLLDELFKSIVENYSFSGFGKENLSHYLDVSEELARNSFGKWGIAKWKEVSPKGTREKAYLILKETKKPLHFREIAEEIDRHSLNKKKTHPQTVHNELIKDDNFVLVGRGIYALAEWGYKKGTVKDVIEEIIKAAKKPLKRDEIIGKVLKVRQVKKSTIVINLNNYFTKSKSGTYSIKK